MSEKKVFDPLYSDRTDISSIGHDVKVVHSLTIRDADDKERGPETLEVRVPITTAMGGSDFPDGGLKAWLVVFGGMCCTFTTFGYVNAWGVFQEYYQETLLKDSSPSSICSSAWIGSIQYCLVFLPGIFVGRLFDLGYFHTILLSCSALLILATFLTAQCTAYWQFLLCQGFVVGLASGGIFGPTMAVIAHWFKKKRGMALGLVAIGSSIGGTVIPIMARNLIPRIGFSWTMRVIGFVLLTTLCLANATLKRRLPPTNVVGGLFNFRSFRSATFSCYCVSSFFVFLGIYTMLTYIDVSAVSLGISTDISFYLVAIVNCSSGVGRYIAGGLSDRYGPLNIMIPLTSFAAIFTYSWPFAPNQASLICVAILYGLSSGAYMSLLPSPLMAMGDPSDVGRRLGICMSILSIGALIGPPISGDINSATRGFQAVGFFAGSTILLGVILMTATRHLLLGKSLGKI
ncbi:MFS general substrate transporter [Desarmillaria tabescens]|uniref:MFS general substrate transporter n=1 Tax=Armillaria tabescens TaxID=1929756 RepID=A0AA39ND98_ARMTA|nr:MFS general substrate transporter [Desarmillaria tabescens]KAK0463531.1 MFS general substrate transporter [Desarmillaria tabescens]